MEKSDTELIYEIEEDNLKDTERKLKELMIYKKFLMDRRRKLKILVSRHKKKISVHKLGFIAPIRLKPQKTTFSTKKKR